MSNFLNTHRLTRVKALAKAWVRASQLGEPLGLDRHQAARLCFILYRQGMLERRYVKVWADAFHRFAGFEYKLVGEQIAGAI
jgi:hypothetical protein